MEERCDVHAALPGAQISATPRPIRGEKAQRLLFIQSLDEKYALTKEKIDKVVIDHNHRVFMVLVEHISPKNVIASFYTRLTR